ncbi:chitinase [Nocardiopsis sp. RSe5-2]|uniref:chitinase n=1 Tax=Nocardiopsis endophytica TaxID=3018445 RepID=A0ABT4U472_9ACTN|nr:chitinase [Nocardiopsis endophytica]MDA2811740.1 chitinase [Nocardiopsis endophytica]
MTPLTRTVAATAALVCAAAGTAAGPAPDPAAAAPAASSTLPDRVMAGYLHTSFANGSGWVDLADVPDQWDIIHLAFAEPTTPTSGRLEFSLCPRQECPGVPDKAEFISQIRDAQARGKKVVLSVGGARGQVSLETAAARDAFVESASAIIDEYGLDGLDVDFEGHSLYLDDGDTDFRSPTTPVIVNLIDALRALSESYGPDFVLTMAPETFFVQLGYTHYGSGPWGGADPRAGAYLPVIHALRDRLTLLHVQHYNSGPIVGLDDRYHTMGSADFHVAMADMVLQGFPVAGDASAVFPPLAPEQVAIGLPASPLAGNGHTAAPEVQAAWDCLTTGARCPDYAPRGTYPGLRGLMSWSINWDRHNGDEFATEHGAHIGS